MPACSDSGAARAGSGVAVAGWDVRCRPGNTNGPIKPAVRLSCRAATSLTPQGACPLSWRKWRPFCRSSSSASASGCLDDDSPPRSHKQVLVTGIRGHGSVFSSTDFSEGSLEPGPCAQGELRARTTAHEPVLPGADAADFAATERQLVRFGSVTQPGVGPGRARVQQGRPRSVLHVWQDKACKEALKSYRPEVEPAARGNQKDPGRAVRPKRDCETWLQPGDTLLANGQGAPGTVTRQLSGVASTAGRAPERVGRASSDSGILGPEVLVSRSSSWEGSHELCRRAGNKVRPTKVIGERRAVSLGQDGAVHWTDRGTSSLRRRHGIGFGARVSEADAFSVDSSRPILTEAVLSDFAASSAGCSMLSRRRERRESEIMSVACQEVMSVCPSRCLTRKKSLHSWPPGDPESLSIGKLWENPPLAVPLPALSGRIRQQNKKGLSSGSGTVQAESHCIRGSLKQGEAQPAQVHLWQLQQQLLDVRGGSVFVTRSGGAEAHQLFPSRTGTEEKGAGSAKVPFFPRRKGARSSSVAVAQTAEPTAQSSTGGEWSRCAWRPRHCGDDLHQKAPSWPSDRAHCRARSHVWNSHTRCSGEESPTAEDGRREGIHGTRSAEESHGGDVGESRSIGGSLCRSGGGCSGMGFGTAAVMSSCGGEVAAVVPGGCGGGSVEGDHSVSLPRTGFEVAEPSASGTLVCLDNPARQETSCCAVSHAVSDSEESGQMTSVLPRSASPNSRCTTSCCVPSASGTSRRECVVCGDGSGGADSKSDSDSTRCSTCGEAEWVSCRGRLSDGSSTIDVNRVPAFRGVLILSDASTSGGMPIKEDGQVAQAAASVRERSGEAPAHTPRVGKTAAQDEGSGATERGGASERQRLVGGVDHESSDDLQLLPCGADIADSLQELETEVAGLDDVEAMLRCCALDLWDAQEVDVYVAPTLHGLHDQPAQVRCADTAAAAALAAAVAATGTLSPSSPAEEGGGGSRSTSEVAIEDFERAAADDDIPRFDQSSYDAGPAAWMGHQAARWCGTCSEGGREESPTGNEVLASKATGIATTTASSASLCAAEYGSGSSTSAASAPSERSDGSPAGSFRSPFSGQEDDSRLGGMEWCGMKLSTNYGGSWAGSGFPDKRSLHSDLLVVKFKYSSLMVQDEDGVLGLEMMPSFEGPLYLINPPSTRRTPAYSRFLKSLPHRRLFFFILSRGHLFWFRSSRDFVARGLGAAAGSLSLVINHCHVDVIDSSSGMPGGRFRLEVKEWGKVLELQTVTGSQGGGSDKHRRRRSRAEAESSRGAWVQQLLATVQKGEQIRNRFQKVDWAQTQHHAMVVADRLGVV